MIDIKGEGGGGQIDFPTSPNQHIVVSRNRCFLIDCSLCDHRRRQQQQQRHIFAPSYVKFVFK